MEASFALVLKDPEAAMVFGRTLGRFMSRGGVIALIGELGAGKTTIVKAIAAGLGVPSDVVVCSPSYTLVNEYEGRIPLYHFDLYRLEDSKDVHELGYDEYIEGDGLCVIEWADVAPEVLPGERIEIRIEIIGDKERRVLVTGKGERYAGIVQRLGRRFGNGAE